MNYLYENEKFFEISEKDCFSAKIIKKETFVIEEEYNKFLMCCVKENSYTLYGNSNKTFKINEDNISHIILLDIVESIVEIYIKTSLDLFLFLNQYSNGINFLDNIN